MYALETHALLWAISKPELLSKSAASVIEKGGDRRQRGFSLELIVKKDKADAPINDPAAW